MRLKIVNKILILPAMLLMSGCASVGELEALNDVGLGDARESISVLNKTLNTSGVQSNTRNASKLNKLRGEYKNGAYTPRGLDDAPRVIGNIR